MVEALLPIAASPSKGWLAENSTLIVGIVGIVVSGVLGPTVAAVMTAKREREKDARARIVDQRNDLREVVDSAAKALGGAVPRLRPALEAQVKEEPLPTGARDFLSELFTLGQRLRLRLLREDPVVKSYDAARAQLIALSKATGSQAEFDTAAKVFEDLRAIFLDQAREALMAPISSGGMNT
jgi:hypothetical protein